MTALAAYAVPLVLLAFALPWCLRMLRTTTTAPALQHLATAASMVAMVGLGAVVIPFGTVPAWTWYPPAAAAAVGTAALCVRWPVLVSAPTPGRRTRPAVSLAFSTALLVLVIYASTR